MNGRSVGHFQISKSSNLQILFILFLLPFFGFSQQVFKKQAGLMGSVFDFVVVADDPDRAERHFEAVIGEIERIEGLISEWRPGTQVSEVNRNAGVRPVKVDRELFELTRRAVEYSRLTDGAFDVSIAAMDRIWRFDGSMTELPSAEAIQNSVRNVGYRHIVLDSANSTVFLEKKGMKIGFGSIGKGYAADKGRELLQSRGVPGGIVNASGDLSAWGGRPDGKPWNIGVDDPHKAHKMAKILKIRYGSAATSGNTEKFAEINGRRYAHIINPKTGWPSSVGLVSVTISGPSAEFANFLSTSVMVLGEKGGGKLVRRFRGYKAFFVREK